MIVPAFTSDRPLRRRYFTEASYQHPAKMHVGLLLWLVERYTLPGQTIIDPMYGIGTTGLAALLQRDVIGFDVESRFLTEAHRNAALVYENSPLFCGRISISQRDARQSWGVTGDVVLCSPPYGCAASPHKGSRMSMLERRKRALERGLLSHRWAELLQSESNGAMGSELFYYGSSPEQIGHLRGTRYWAAMRDIYTQARQALRTGGLMILVIKDHIRAGQRVETATQTATFCEGLGFSHRETLLRPLPTLSLWQRRRRERGEPVVEDEAIVILEAA